MYFFLDSNHENLRIIFLLKPDTFQTKYPNTNYLHFIDKIFVFNVFQGKNN